MVEDERSEKDRMVLGLALRPYAADTLAALAECLRSVREETADPECLRRTDSAVTTLATVIREARRSS